MSDDTPDGKITLDPEYQIQIEIEAEAAGLSVKDYLKLLLKEYISELKADDDPPPNVKTIH